MEAYIYVLVFAIALVSLNTIDFRKIVKRNTGIEFWVLYLIVVMSLTELASSFIINFVNLIRF